MKKKEIFKIKKKEKNQENVKKIIKIPKKIFKKSKYNTFLLNLKIFDFCLPKREEKMDCFSFAV